MLRKLGLLLLALGLAAWAAPAAAAEPCSVEELGKAVDEAGATLRAFNLANAPLLQSKLGQLRDKKGWSEADYEEKAHDFLADERTQSFDATANELLTKIDQLGRATEGAGRDCARLDELKAAGVELLAVMKAKSAYAIGKIDKELAAESPRVAVTVPPPAPKPQPPPSQKPQVAAIPAPAQPPPPSGAKQGPAFPQARQKETSSWSTTSELNASVARAPLPPPSSGSPDASLPPDAFTNDDEGYTIDEIREATRGFFGTISTNLASVLEHAFRYSGRPTAYVLGQEGGGAFLAGLRYGSGTLYMRSRAGTEKIYWHGPSLGYDFGAEGSRTMFLIYKVQEPQQLYRSFTGIDGSAYLVGGFGITFLKGGEVIMAPIRSGLGLRLGANVGYIRFSAQPSWNPF